MALQFTKTTETPGKSPFISNLETLPGGVTVAIADLVETTVKAGTPIGLDSGTGLYHVVKTAEAQDAATSSATDYKVLKGHNFKVGNFLTSALLKKAFAITSITTTETDYDTLTLGTTLGVAIAEGDVLIEATAQATGNTSAYKYTPVGLVGSDFDVVSGANHLTDCVVRGSVIESMIVPISSDIKTTLSHIRFV